MSSVNVLVCKFCKCPDKIYLRPTDTLLFAKKTRAHGHVRSWRMLVGETMVFA